MKNNYTKKITFALFMGICTSIAYSQCTINPIAEADVTLDGVNVSNVGISVAYSPTHDLYYAADGGYTNSNLVTFDETGTELFAGINCGYDFRGVWWNPNTDQLEANSYSATGVRQCDIDGSFYGLTTGTIILPDGQPTTQSQGDYDWDDDEIIYYYSGSIYRYSHATGALLSSYPITGLPVPTSNLSSETIGYTGCVGQEIVVYDILLQAAYTIDKATGAYVATSEMPDAAPVPGAWYNVSYANGQIFIRSGIDWFGYRIFPACAALTVEVSAFEVCEGEEVTLDAEGVGAITWDGGVIDEEPFIPGGPGTYEYTPSSDAFADCEGSPVEIVVLAYESPTVLAGAGDLIFCEDEMITLAASGDADAYEWNDGEALDLMPGIGTYTFELTGVYEDFICSLESTDEVTVEVVALPTITASADESLVCIGNEVVLTGGGGETYEWDNDVIDGEDFETTELGTTTYTVIGTDGNGCVNMASVEVEVVDLITITGTSEDEITGDDGSIDITVSGGAPTFTYDWDIDGTGDFDDDEDLTGLGAGIYTVVVMSDAGCTAEYTITVNGQLGLGDSDAQNIAIYPNPTQSNITIQLTGNFDYTLYAINGDVVFNGSAKNIETLSLVDLADGVYFVSIQSETISTTTKIIKK